MSKEYGYTRISTPKQNIDRQVRNILAEHPQAHMIKEIILKHNKAFGGSLNDIETIRQAGITRKTFYKYKKELLSNTVA